MGELSTAWVSVVAFTHQGQVREGNEDTIAIGQWSRNRPMVRPEMSQHKIDSPFVGIVADGMGGHAAGEVASQFVVNVLTDAAPVLEDEDAIAHRLKRANESLFDLMSQQANTTGMGTTIAGIAITLESVFAFNVGDSRVYRERHGYLNQLTKDDSSGHTSYGEKAQEEKTGVLSQALGGASQFVEIEPHVVKEAMFDNQRYLICSDGLSDMVNIDTMEACLTDSDVDSVRSLFEKAMQAGGRDNISVLMIRTHLHVSEESTVED